MTEKQIRTKTTLYRAQHKKAATGRVVSEETRKKMSLAKIGNKNARKKSCTLANTEKVQNDRRATKEEDTAATR